MKADASDWKMIKKMSFAYKQDPEKSLSFEIYWIKRSSDMKYTYLTQKYQNWHVKYLILKNFIPKTLWKWYYNAHFAHKKLRSKEMKEVVHIVAMS
jgi:hypothetical protein